MAIWLILSFVLVQISNSSGFMNIAVNNGESDGVWNRVDRCEFGTFAVGFDIKVEERKAFPHDNTALNGIKLICESDNGTSGGNVTSSVGPWGNWLGASFCDQRNGIKFYLTSFSLQVHKKYNMSSMTLSEFLDGPDEYLDNTAVNFIKFKCRDREARHPSYELVKPPGRGERGQYGEWSKECPAGQAVCGISTRVDDGEFRNFEDDTALNDVLFHCCQTDPFDF